VDIVLKIGGSLSKYPYELKELCLEIGKLSKEFKILVVPGGAKFADVAREYHSIYGLSDNTSHWVAILAMEQYGIILSELIPNSKVIRRIKDYRLVTAAGEIPIFLPYSYMLRIDPLEHSWDVTSDSISLYIACKIGAKKLVLIKDVDGVYDANGNLLDKVSIEWLSENKSCLDKYFPLLASKCSIRRIFIINGLFPGRLRKVLYGERTICTEVIK